MRRLWRVCGGACLLAAWPMRAAEPAARPSGSTTNAAGLVATAAETERGFLVTELSRTTPRRRLAELEIDVGLGEGELAPVEVFALRDLDGLRLEVTASGPWSGALQGEAEHGFRLLPGGATVVSNGACGRLWLRVRPVDRPGTIRGVATVADGAGGRAELPLRVTVWPVKLPREHMLPLNPFTGPHTLGLFPWLDGSDTNMLPRMLDVVQALGGSVFQFPLSASARFRDLLRERRTGLPFPDYFKQHGPAAFDALPDLDLSRLDPLTAMMRERGMMRVELQTTATPRGAGYQNFDGLARLATGRSFPDDEAGWTLTGWLAGQYRDYLNDRGFTNLWVKIDDEINAGEIPAWIEAARRWRSFGFKVETTLTYGIPRSVEAIERLAAATDGWIIPTVYMRDFLDRVRHGAVLATNVTAPAAPAWVRYGNGGASNTWNSRQVLPADLLSSRIERLDVTLDGQPLRSLLGQSPYGNQRAGVCYKLGRYLYVAPADGRRPHDAQLEVTIVSLQPAPGRTPLVRLARGASLWYYGGGYYSDGYLDMRAATWPGCCFGWHGRAHFGCYQWKPEFRLWWYENGGLVFSPAYEGLRDAAEDSAYYRCLVAAGAPRDVLDAVAGMEPGAALPLTTQGRNGEYEWPGVADAVSYADFNRAKRMLLKHLGDRP